MYLTPEPTGRQSKRALMHRTCTTLLFLLIILIPPTVSAEEIVINAVGDIMLAGRWSPQIKKTGYDQPFRATAPVLAAGDITIANLESPIAGSGTEFVEKKFRFMAEPAIAKAIRNAGINLVTLANNHIMDFGPEALFETRTHLKTAGIDWIGAGANLSEARRPQIYTVKGKRIAFLGYSLTLPTEFFAGKSSPGTAPGFARVMVEDITQAKSQADFVIVSIHWGTEGKNFVQPYQRTLAHKAVDAGADVILGHHPHVLRGIERYNKGLIFYSLGNFVFASKSRTAESSLIVRIRLDDLSREAELLPLDILHRRVGFQPRPASAEKSEQIISHLNDLSAPLQTQILGRDGRYTVRF